MENAGIRRIRAGLPALEWVWVVDDHWDFHRGSRTVTGELVHRAKPYGSGDSSDPAAVHELVDLMFFAARCAGDRILPVDLVVPVPADPGRRGLNLPDELARGLASRAHVRCAPRPVRKVKTTPEMKIQPREVKARLLRGAFRGQPPRGEPPRRVLVVDDLVLTGHTLAAVAEALRSIGIREVVALAATRVKKGMASIGR